MKFWEQLRTCWRLAERVDAVEEKCDGIVTEWTDILDKLKQREERQRKRDQRLIRAGLAEHASDPAPAGEIDAAGAARGDPKAALRARARTMGLMP